MGQASILKFLQRHKKSKKKWLTTKEIYEKMKNTKDGSGIGSVTTSIKKLRESGMINYKEMQIKKSSRLVLHYRAK